jgi:CRP-like cAMP-binding protein
VTGSDEIISLAAVRPILEPVAPLVSCPPGTRLFGQGELLDNVFLIEDGLAKLVRLEQSGRALLVGVRTPGWLLGLASAIAMKPSPLCAEAVQSVRARVLPVALLRDLFAVDRAVAQYVGVLLAREVVEGLVDLSGLRTLPADARLRRLLARFVGTELAVSSRPQRLRLPLKHWELADSIGVTPQYLARLLRRLEQEDLIDWDRGLMVVLNPGALLGSVLREDTAAI